MKRQFALLLSVLLVVIVLASCGRTPPYESELAETANTTETTSYVPIETTADIIPYRTESAPPPPFPYYQEENAYLCDDFCSKYNFCSKYIVIYHVYNTGTQPIIVYPYEFKVRWSDYGKSGSATISSTPSYLFGGEDGYVTIEVLFPELVSNDCSISYSGTVAWKPAKKQVKLYDVKESCLEARYDDSSVFQGILITAKLEDESVSNVLQLNLTIFDKEGIPLRTFSGSGTASSGSLQFFFPLFFGINRQDIASYEISVSDMCREIVP